jgi:DNA-binding PadR family transcriptional regulator
LAAPGIVPDVTPTGGPALSLTEHVVLSLLSEESAHGFAIARMLGRDSVLAEAWSVAHPLVYRAIGRLHEQGLIYEAGEEPGEPGPRRVIYDVTPAGREVAARWRAEPVHHVREVRSTFLAKVLLRRRAGEPLRPLVAGQRAAFEPLFRQLADRASGDAGDRIIRAWRVESSRAVERLLHRLEALDDERVGDAGRRL